MRYVKVFVRPILDYCNARIFWGVKLRNSRTFSDKVGLELQIIVERLQKLIFVLVITEKKRKRNPRLKHTRVWCIRTCSLAGSSFLFLLFLLGDRKSVV